MNHHLTDITIVLDRSASMHVVREATVNGYNTFVREQAKLPGQALLSLVQFDDQYDTVYSGVECSQVKPLTEAAFIPRGNTALLDAIGRTIDTVGVRLDAMPEAQRPGKVVIVIHTDGMENASRRYTRSQVFEMITHQREVYGWDFVFLGANQDAIAAGAAIGVPAHSSLSYAHDDDGASAVMDAMSNYVGTVRSLGSATFTAADREQQRRGRGGAL